VSDFTVGTWVIYTWDNGYHLRSVYETAEKAVRACDFGGEAIVFLRYGQDMEEAVRWQRGDKAATPVPAPSTTDQQGRP